MSDLIEKIRKCANMPCMDMEGNPDPSGYRSGMWITAEDADQILSALETVRGIEEIMQNETHFSLYRGNFKYYVQVRSCDRSVDVMKKVPVKNGHQPPSKRRGSNNEKLLNYF